jgi:hypothetical protein
MDAAIDGSMDGPGVDMSTTGCDDGVPCTEDTMGPSGCIHHPLHAQCPVGDYCDLTVGCTSGTPCSDADDCPVPDACVIPRCVAATRTCSYGWLDGDHDGHVPIICGGDDCDDSRFFVYPGNGLEDQCNGADDDCDGTVDNGPDEGGCAVAYGAVSTCVNGDCTCPATYHDCTHRVDVFYGCSSPSDPRWCGECWNYCPEESHCDGTGGCVCDDASMTVCEFGGYGLCVDTATDELNCGECRHECGGTCVDGGCDCPVGDEACYVVLAFTYVFTECTASCATLCASYAAMFGASLTTCEVVPP